MGGRHRHDLQSLPQGGQAGLETRKKQIASTYARKSSQDLALICTRDVAGHTPLSLAVLRQNPKVVQHVLTVARAQFTPLPTVAKPAVICVLNVC